MPSMPSQPRRTVPAMPKYTTQPPSLFHPDVEVRVSARRKKTAGAHWEGDRMVIVVPTHLKGAARDEMVETLSRRLLRHRPLLHTSDDELAQRAQALGQRYLEGVEAASIRWATNQNTRWGSCTIGTREIRISHRLKMVPGWVLDAVIVHELAHLIERNHNARFRQLENRFPRRAEADVFLDGYALGMHMSQGGGGEQPASEDGFQGDLVDDMDDAPSGHDASVDDADDTTAAAS